MKIDTPKFRKNTLNKVPFDIKINEFSILKFCFGIKFKARIYCILRRVVGKLWFKMIYSHDMSIRLRFKDPNQTFLMFKDARARIQIQLWESNLNLIFAFLFFCSIWQSYKLVILYTAGLKALILKLKNSSNNKRTNKE